MKKLSWVWKKTKIFVFLIAMSVLLTLCSLVLTVIPTDFKLIEILIEDKLIVLMNLLPIVFIMYILLCIVNRLWISFFLTSIFVFLVIEINRFKIIFRDDPFVFSDFMLVKEANNMLGQYELFVDKVSWCAILFIVLMTFICFVLAKRERINKKIRIFGGIGVFIIMCITISQLHFNNSNIYEKTWHWQFGSQWKSASQYLSRGCVYSFVHSIPDAFSIPPEGYSEAYVEEKLAKYKEVDIPEDKKVHTIAIMLEAFNDFSKFEGVEFVKNPYENFHALQSESYRGNLFTNIFAAGTIDTERAFLTGYGEPILNNRNTESYVQYFKRQGYYTEAMHPCYGYFYNRRNVNSNLGFDNFDYQENAYADVNYDKLYHGLMMDDNFFDFIIKGHEKAVEDNKMYFNFSATYQNHGPYDTSPITEVEYLKQKDEYTEDEYNIINNYLDGIANTDAALLKLRTYIDSSEEPIVLIIFGDHNPWMGEDNSALSMLGVNLDLSTIEGAENYYQTPYLFYANQNAKECLGKSFNQVGNTVSPMFLMNEYFEYIDLEGSMYMNYLHDLKEIYDVINKVVIKKDDKYCFIDDNENDKLLIEQRMVEYYMLNDFRPYE